MPKLIVKRGPNRGIVYTFAESKVTIGRDYTNPIFLVDQTVSRQHAQLTLEDDVWYLDDLGSRNGTRINGKQADHSEVQSMDEIGVGDVVLTFVDQAKAEVATAGGDTRVLEAPITDVLATDPVEAISLAQHSNEELRHVNTRLLALFQLSNVAAGARSRPEFFERVVAILKQVLAPDRVMPLLVNTQNRLGVVDVAKAAFDKKLHQIPMSNTIVSYVRERLESVLSQSTAADERFQDSPSIAKHKISSAVCVPLKIGKRLLGVIYIDRLGDSPNFSRADLEFLAAAAMPLSVALENIEAWEEMSGDMLTLERHVKGEFDIVGKSQPMREVFEFISKAAPTDAGVLITGESGTGKELVARAIHYSSHRRGKPFEAVNCAALTITLLESELFGHVKGAFTGATEDKPGHFELANGGSIFLDEIGEMPEESQTKLLRVLEQGQIRRVGDIKDRSIDVRVIAATNQALEERIKEGRFRQDLFYRLHVLTVSLPPLRSRPDDLPTLAHHFLRIFAGKCGKPKMSFADRVLDLFLKYPWPGNVRELKNVIERMVVMSSSDRLTAKEVPIEVRTAQPGMASAELAGNGTLAEVEKAHVMRVLQNLDGNKKRAAEELGIDRSTLYSKLKSYGIS